MTNYTALTQNCCVLDTNILLDDASNIFSIQAQHPNSTIVIPEVVLDEIDAKKTGFTEIAFQAREVNRLLTKAKQVDTTLLINARIISLKLEDINIAIVGLDNYDIQDANPNTVNDYKIIHTAKFIKETLNRYVTLFTNDIACGLKASLYVDAIESTAKPMTSKVEFTKTLDLDYELFSTVNNKLIIDIDKEYKPENFNYIFTTEKSAQKKLAYIKDGICKVIGKETEQFITKQSLPPINVGQKMLSRAILDMDTPVVICEALSGSGKTATAISNAIKLVGMNSPYSGIKYIRASVDDLEKAEEVGFLPGLEDKFKVYLHPMKDTLEAIARKKYSGTKDARTLEDKVAVDVENTIGKYNIESMITLGLRGRTITDSVVIIDEVQNMSKKSLQKVLTRVGKNCKVIIIGSNRQIDNAFVNKYTNGLSALLKACTEEQSTIKLYAITLDKVVRSDISEWAENLFSKDS